MVAPLRPETAAAATTMGPLHTNGVDSVIYNASNEPVRLVGFNWTGMDGRPKRLPEDRRRVRRARGAHLPTTGGLTITYDDFYQNLAIGDTTSFVSRSVEQPRADRARRGTPRPARYVHNWNPNYLNDLRSMVTKARAAGIMVILDMQQDFWSPALHNITNWDGTPGYCEGYGMPRWMYPSIDVKPRPRRAPTSTTA